jgi:hypothetical protein
LSISGEYQALNAECHEQNAGWGKGGVKHLDTILELTEPGDRILDYGCGKGALVDVLADCRRIMSGYDPAVPGFDYNLCIWECFDWVVSTDVLEHVEPEHLDDVLSDLYRVAPRGFFTIALKPAVKRLPDGSNAHRIVETARWWVDKLTRLWDVVSIRRQTPGMLEVEVYRGD